MKLSKVIAIDGPSGSGKSTMAKRLAESLDLLYIDTGAMFRALGLKAYKEGISFEWNEGLSDFISNVEISYGESKDCLIRVNGEDLTSEIREHHVSKLASIISQVPEVRDFLLDFQRGLADKKLCVMEGRDIGTVVFPNAFCKFFITASVEVRSQRRLDQLQENGEASVDLSQIMVDVKRRDESDMNRSVAPLREASDAIHVDTSNMKPEEVLHFLVNTSQDRVKTLGL